MREEQESRKRHACYMNSERARDKVYVLGMNYPTGTQATTTDLTEMKVNVPGVVSHEVSYHFH